MHSRFPACLFSSFVLAICVAASQAAPVVFRVSDPVEPGETALLFGDGIGEKVVATGWRLPDTAVSEPPGAPAEAAIAENSGTRLGVLQASDLAAKVLLPADWKPGVFAVRLNGGPPVLLNRPELWWWLGGEAETAFTGETLRIFGKNLGANTRAWLSGGGKSWLLPAVQAETYTGTYTVPADLPPGDYALWAHNGLGGATAWAGPLKVKVSARMPWPKDVFDVRNFGARGSGEVDDTPAFTAALAQAAAKGGGVVYVPRGTYRITAKLVIPTRTILRGEKREWVWLYTPKDLPPIDSVLAGNGDFAVEELSIVSQTARRMVVCPDHPSMYARERGQDPPEGQAGHNARLHRLRLQQLFYAHRLQDKEGDPRRMVPQGEASIVLAGPDMEISDSEVLSSGMPFALHNMQRCRISGNHLENGRNGWYAIWSAVETVFENNLIEARDLEGTYGGVQGGSYHSYFAGNTYRDAYGNEREALTFDSPYYAKWMGRVAAADGTTLTGREENGAVPAWKPGELRGLACYVAFGKGLGQYLEITDNTGSTLTLKHPWAVPLDATSRVALVVMKTDTVVTSNSFADASVAVQLYCQGYGMIVDGNRAERTGGIYGNGWGPFWTAARGQFRFSVCCFNQFLHNDLSQGFVYQQGPSLHGMLGPCADGSPANEIQGVNTIGNIIRDNIARDHFTVGALYGRPHPFTPPSSSVGYFGRDTIIEGNRVLDTPLALEVYPRYLDTLLRHNQVERSATPLRDDGTGTWIDPAERLQYHAGAVKTALGEVPGAASASSLAQLWAAVSQMHPEGIPAELVRALTGLHYQVAANAALLQAVEARQGGKATITLRVRTEPWSPEIGIQTEKSSQVIKPGEVVNVPTEVALPEASAPSARLHVTLTVRLDDKPVSFTEDFAVLEHDLER